MKFGQVEHPGDLNLVLPSDHPDTRRILSQTSKGTGRPQIYVGCAKWNRKELKNFYPRGTKDELSYYASRFNAIELNATFYRNFPTDQVSAWVDKVPDDFRFFPKVHQEISHRKWLSNVEDALDRYLNSIVHFKGNLGTAFLQLRGNFSPKHFDRLREFLELWPQEVSLAVELRHKEWYQDPVVSGELYQLLEENNVSTAIVDTAGRRDLIHQRLTRNEAFIRYVGANHPSDYDRLDEWVERLKKWHEQGLNRIHFFVHQNVEEESPLLASHFVRRLNQGLGTDLTVPVEVEDPQGDLF